MEGESQVLIDSEGKATSQQEVTLGRRSGEGGILLAPFGSPQGLMGDPPLCQWCPDHCPGFESGQREKNKDLVYWGREKPPGMKEKQNS